MCNWRGKITTKNMIPLYRCKMKSCFCFYVFLIPISQWNHDYVVQFFKGNFGICLKGTHVGSAVCKSSSASSNTSRINICIGLALKADTCTSTQRYGPFSNSKNLSSLLTSNHGSLCSLPSQIGNPL